jgi:hypothetical protein
VFLDEVYEGFVCVLDVGFEEGDGLLVGGLLWVDVGVKGFAM